MPGLEPLPPSPCFESSNLRLCKQILRAAPYAQQGRGRLDTPLYTSDCATKSQDPEAA